MIISTFEHVYIITAWCITDFSDSGNDSENVLFAVYLLSAKSLYVATYNPLAADQIAVKTKEGFPFCWSK